MGMKTALLQHCCNGRMRPRTGLGYIKGEICLVFPLMFLHWFGVMDILEIPMSIRQSIAKVLSNVETGC